MQPGRPSLVGRIRKQAEFPKRLLQHRTEQIRCSIPGTTSKQRGQRGNHIFRCLPSHRYHRRHFHQAHEEGRFMIQEQLSSPPFLVDANCLIEPYNRYYNSKFALSATFGDICRIWLTRTKRQLSTRFVTRYTATTVRRSIPSWMQ